MPQPSVQLYSARNELDRNFDVTLERIAGIGFTRVEPYAFHERVDDYARALNATGLVAPSGHAATIDSATPAAVFDAANRLGIATVIDPFVPSDRWRTADDAARNAERVNELTALASTFGLRFGYHNHQWEFMNIVDGRPIYELFVQQLEPDVILEVDTFWSTVAGIDTPVLLTDLGERVQFLHIKDGAVGGDIATVLPSAESALIVPDALAEAFKRQTPAGQGQVPINRILEAAPQAVRVVEFDDYSGDIFDGLAASYAWLARNDT